MAGQGTARLAYRSLGSRVLTLGAPACFGDLDPYWRYHAAREHERLYPPPTSELIPSAFDRGRTRNEPQPLEQAQCLVERSYRLAL